uniref:NHL domain-containing protein n=1 Tax=Davidia involucrata TaxID=16924 RepID=A0A5B7BUC9_DAVIN
MATPKDEDEMQEIAFAKRGCCFWIPCIGVGAAERSPSTAGSTSSTWWERIRTAEKEESWCWWSNGWKNVKVWSELVAGPRWKTFIRRFNKNRVGGGKFHYDPLSYALNFDDGPGQNGHLDEDYAYRDFSIRYASIPASAKSSMDLGKEGAPSFI